MKAARRVHHSEGAGRGLVLLPRPVSRPRERWDGGRDLIPRVAVGPDETRSARAEQPLVAPGNEHITTEIGHGRILAAEAMNSVDHEPDAVARAALAIEFGNDVGHRTNRQLDTGRGVHPRGGDDARISSDLTFQVADDLLDAHFRRLRI